MRIDTRIAAPAKVNLTLHVTGRREDGYHLLDSLVVFAGIADRLIVAPAPRMELVLSGQFASGLPDDGRNSVLQAADALREIRGVSQSAQVRLEKLLPSEAGLGGGSADAAAALKLLADFWKVERLSQDDPVIAALGADVPVCHAGPAPQIMRGIGEEVHAAPALPDCALVLCNPIVNVPTAEVYAALPQAENAPMERMPAKWDYDGFVGWLKRQRNDLQAPAEKIAPEISRALAKLDRMPGVAHAGMSGSGGTCYALVRDMAAARQVARAVQVSEMGWWVVPAELLR